MKKILIIGNSGSIFVKNFCEQFVYTDCLVDVLSLGSYDCISGVRVNKALRRKKWYIDGKLIRIFFTQIELKRLVCELDHDYDCVVIHYVDYRLSFVMNELVNRSKKIVSVIWGSDFYQSSRFQRFLQRNIFEKSSVIVFTNPATADDFEKSRSISSPIPLAVARFGLPTLDEIKTIRKHGTSRIDLCDFFGVPSDKILILAGYNSNLSQQQELIINEFSRIDESIRSKVFIIFPLGYGNPIAENVIRDLLRLHGIYNFKILNSFYGYHDVAKLRCITDLLINIQPSDQFSASMQETLYAGGRVIAGAWLPYKEISQSGASIRYINSLEEIGSAIKSEIENGVSRIDFGSEEICSYIYNSSSWQENIKIWMNIMFDHVIKHAK